MNATLEKITTDYQAGKTLFIDKPLDWTSFDVVNKIKYKLKHSLKIKKIKVGHAGTLDPLATGLLIICTGKNTKKIELFQGLDKTYTGHFVLGATRPSFDKETEIDKTFSTNHITTQMMKEACEQMIGQIQQRVPIFSAIKIDGKRSYDLARAGKEVRIKTRPVCINHFEIDTSLFPEIRFEISCSKGTYIRAIANDFGQLLNSGAYLGSLRRTKIGQYSVVNAHTIEDWVEKMENSCKV